MTNNNEDFDWGEIQIGKMEWPTDPSMILADIEGNEIVKFDKNGVYYQGRKLTLDNEISEALKEWVTGMGRDYGALRTQINRYEQEIMRKNAEIRALKERLEGGC